MAVPKHKLEKTSFNQVLKLASQLAPKEQEKLVQAMQLEELRREIMIGVKEIEQGEGIPGEQVFQHLRARHNELVRKSAK
jgi:hypothetical protein